MNRVNEPKSYLDVKFLQLVIRMETSSGGSEDVSPLDYCRKSLRLGVAQVISGFTMSVSMCHVKTRRVLSIAQKTCNTEISPSVIKPL